MSKTYSVPRVLCALWGRTTDIEEDDEGETEAKETKEYRRGSHESLNFITIYACMRVCVCVYAYILWWGSYTSWGHVRVPQRV